MVTDTAQKLAARAQGTEPLTLERNLDSYEAAQARIAQVQEIVSKVDRSVVDGRIEATVTIGMGPGKSADTTLAGYVNGYVLPNLFFHVNTAYGILRKEGVPLGKQDYLASFLTKQITQ